MRSRVDWGLALVLRSRRFRRVSFRVSRLIARFWDERGIRDGEESEIGGRCLIVLIFLMTLENLGWRRTFLAEI